MALRLAGRFTGGWRRFQALLWTAAGASLLLYLTTLAVLIIYRHPRRIDFTREQENSLSAETLSRLQLLKEDVRVIFPLFIQKDNPLHEIQARILLRARALLKEYMVRQPRIQLEAELDLRREADAESWRSICDRYNLSSNLANRFIFVAGEPAQGQLRQSVSADDLAIYDKPLSTHDPAPAQIHKFRAEGAFTTALSRIIWRERKRVYAVEDQGEPGLLDQAGLGLSSFRKELEVNGFDPLPLRLHEEPRVPGNCDLLLVLAPQSGLSIEDRGKINDYLLAGGRLLVAFGPNETGLEALLDSWNVRAQTGRVLQKRTVGPRSVWDPNFLARDFNVSHPISDQFRPGAFGVLFTGARALELRVTDDLHGEFLLRTPESPPSFLDRDRNGRLDPGEKAGQIVVAGAVWRPRPARPPPDYHHLETRIVALGDVTPLTNQRFRDFSHRDFLLNSVSWLLGREEQVVAGSSAWTQRRLRWDPEIERFLFWVPICLFPGIVVSLGGFIYFLRRS
jgi:hypothetical protein